MKHLTLLLFAVLASITHGGEINLQWDDDQPGMIYRIEMASPVQAPGTPVWTTVKDNIPQVTPTPLRHQTTITGIAPGRYLFRAFAKDPASQLESLPSDELDTTVNPSTPGQLRKKVALQESSDMKEWRDVYVEISPAIGRMFYRATIAMIP